MGYASKSTSEKRPQQNDSLEYRNLKDRIRTEVTGAFQPYGYVDEDDMVRRFARLEEATKDDPAEAAKVKRWKNKIMPIFYENAETQIQLANEQNKIVPEAQKAWKAKDMDEWKRLRDKADDVTDKQTQANKDFSAEMTKFQRFESLTYHDREVRDRSGIKPKDGGTWSIKQPGRKGYTTDKIEKGRLIQDLSSDFAPRGDTYATNKGKLYRIETDDQGKVSGLTKITGPEAKKIKETLKSSYNPPEKPIKGKIVRQKMIGIEGTEAIIQSKSGKEYRLPLPDDFDDKTAKGYIKNTGGTWIDVEWIDKKPHVRGVSDIKFKPYQASKAAQQNRENRRSNARRARQASTPDKDGWIQVKEQWK